MTSNNNSAMDRGVQVLCLGMSRTGTMSLRAAFETLGYHNTYHYRVPSIERPTHSKFWEDAFRRKYEHHGPSITRQEFDTVYEDFEVISDSPSVFFWKELLDAYPDAKVVLQTRPMEVWYKSHINNIWSFNREYYGPVGLNPYWWFFRLFQPRGAFWSFSGLQAKYGHGIESTEQVRRNYVKHNDEVRQYCKEKGRPCLEYDIAMGWQPLCDFLAKSVPREEFPRLNDTKTFQEEWRPILADVRRDIHRKMMLLTIGLLGGLSALLWRSSSLQILIKRVGGQ